MISWKHSFGRLNEESAVARKKRQALDNLLRAGRISQSTHEIFNKEIDDAIAEIEKQQKVLLEKMAAKVVELEGQVKTLEIILANLEIRHVTGEVDDETYQREGNLLSMGLETAKDELDEVKSATDQLARGDLTLEQDVEERERGEDAKVEVKFLDEGSATEEAQPVEHHEQAVVETLTCTETSSKEAETKVEKKQEA